MILITKLFFLLYSKIVNTVYIYKKKIKIEKVTINFQNCKYIMLKSKKLCCFFFHYYPAISYIIYFAELNQIYHYVKFNLKFSKILG